MTQERAITISMPAIPTLSEVESLKEICKVAAYSGFLSSTAPMNNMNARVADAFFVVMYGRELGIPAMTALKTIYVIDGKPSCSGQALLSLMRRAGVQVVIPDPANITDKATIRIKRPDGEWREYTYTAQMAKAANLSGRGTWSKYPREMMIWRAVSMANKYECSDITGGLYTIEELAPNAALDAEGAPMGDIVSGNAAPVQKQIDTSTGEVKPPPVQNASPASTVPIQQNVASNDPLSWIDEAVPGATVTEIPTSEPIYTVTKIKVVPSGSSHMYILGALSGENIALFGGDKFRELMLDPEPWKANVGKWNKLSNNLRVKASLTDDKWAVEWIEQEF